MPSKNKIGVWVLAPAWQVTGVLFTAFVLSTLLFHFQTRFAPLTEPPFLYPKLLFFCVAIFYSLDHIYDELKFARTLAERNISLVLNGLCCGLTMLFLFWQIVKYYAQINFQQTFLPIALTVVYFLLVLGLKIPLRGIKEIIIALVVSAALFYPQVSANDWVGNLRYIFPVFLVCLQNLVVFGFFEKDKDDHYGFSTVFSEVGLQKAHRYTLLFLATLTTLLVLFFLFIDDHIFAVFYCSGAYVFMALFPAVFRKFRLYRFVADGLLLLLLL